MKHSVRELTTSDSAQFVPIINGIEGYFFQSVILNVVVVSKSHLGKIVLCLGSGARIKGLDKLPG